MCSQPCHFRRSQYLKSHGIFYSCFLAYGCFYCRVYCRLGGVFSPWLACLCPFVFALNVFEYFRMHCDRGGVLEIINYLFMISICCDTLFILTVWFLCEFYYCRTVLLCSVTVVHTFQLCGHRKADISSWLFYDSLWSILWQVVLRFKIFTKSFILRCCGI